MLTVLRIVIRVTDWPWEVKILPGCQAVVDAPDQGGGYEDTSATLDTVPSKISNKAYSFVIKLYLFTTARRQ